MKRLRHTDLRIFSEALSRLYAPGSLKEFPTRVHDAFGCLFPSLSVSYDEINYETGLVLNVISQEVPISRQEFIDRWTHCSSLHPGVMYLASGGTRKILQISDFYSDREFRDTAFYQDFWRCLDLTHQVALVATSPEGFAGVAVNRDQVFTAEEVSLMELIYPHFVQAYKTAQLLAGLPTLAAEFDFIPLRRKGITRRECDVLQWLIQGKRNGEIAIILGISPATVKLHVERILAKLGVETRTAAASRVREILGEFGSVAP